MAQVQELDDLQIDQDLLFQQRSWRMQRIGWWGMALVLLAALLGLFGAGPLSFATATDSSGQLRLTYERFLRFNTATTLTLQVQPSPQQPTELRLWLNRDYIDAFQIQQITPAPARMQVGSTQIVLSFELVDASQPVKISLQLYTIQMGSWMGEVGLANGSTILFWHFVYP